MKIVDPNGLGEGQPSVGFGFRMAERYAGIPNDTLSRWVLELEGNKCLQAPSGKTFRVLDILVSDPHGCRSNMGCSGTVLATIPHQWMRSLVVAKISDIFQPI